MITTAGLSSVQVTCFARDAAWEYVGGDEYTTVVATPRLFLPSNESIEHNKEKKAIVDPNCSLQTILQNGGRVISFLT